ncbi:MAG: hypothetical protein K2G30_07685 [Muribaculaceae bacterium]|nr:hypothetical protein [Muribaculaceae bacterium]MDE7142940.1 hypothetical protein [Muribaculaceae bacterium]
MRFSLLRKKLLTAAVWLAALLPAGGAPCVSAQDTAAAQDAPGRHGVARRGHIPPASLPDSIYVGAPLPQGAEVVTEEVRSTGDSLQTVAADTIPVADLMPEPFPDLTPGEAFAADSVAAAANAKPDEWVRRQVEFTPDPTRAVWLSALFPGLGQVYNRRYWKLPIIVGGYMGLGYAVSWNNTMLTDYTRAYADLLDNDPSSKSYMDLFAPNVKEEDIDKDWLQRVLRSKKNYFRRNRDLCVICMVGVYLLAMVDAYVDASLSHFDISPDLSMDVQPALLQDGRQRYPSVGLVWALNF